MRIADNRLARAIATGYVETVRNIPLLVVLYILFLVLPLYGLPINALTAGVLVWRSTVPPLPSRSSAAGLPRSRRAQHEAARALGLRPTLIMALVIVPQVFRIVLPTLGNQIVSVVPRLGFRLRSSGSAN